MIKYKKYKQKHKYKYIKKKNLLSLAKIYIHCNLKNTLISLTKKKGEVLKQWSTKSLKKTKFKKNTPYNIQLIIYKINKYIKLKKINKIYIYIKGSAFGRFFVLRNFNKNKFKIIKIFDKTSRPFNGCRVKKMKRR